MICCGVGEFECVKMAGIVIDAGSSRFLGVLSIENMKYTPYRGASIPDAITRIYAAEKLVTFNGTNYDLAPRGEFPELQNLPKSVIHIDMMGHAWNARREFFGKSLREIYALIFGRLPSFPDTYEGSNEQDCYMTLKLFELWEAGKLGPRLGQESVDVPGILPHT